MYQWLRGVPLSGLSFPLVTASGTYAKNYNTAQLSGVISKDGGAWAALGSRLSGIPGDGIYTLCALSSTEMTCYSWLIKITANSGCLDQAILGYNLSGPVLNADISGFAHSIDCSGNNAILVATSNIPLAVASGWVGCSGNDNILQAVSNIPATVNYSSIAQQVWNTVRDIATSGTTFGGAVNISGFDGLVTAVSGLKNDISGLPQILLNQSGLATLTSVSGLRAPIENQVWDALVTNHNLDETFGWHIEAIETNVTVSSIARQVWNTVQTVATSATTFGGLITAISGLKNDVSGLPGLYANTSGLAHALDCSGIHGVLVATSAVPAAVGALDVTDAAGLTSGTLAHTARLLRWFSWDGLVIDKRYTPNRLYLKTSATATSSYWNLTDDADTTNRTRGG